MGKKKVKKIVDTTYDASKDENLKRQNSFLVVCVCSIIFILMLCYFGINSFKGTSAADTTVCLNGETKKVHTDGNVYCCASDDQLMQIGSRAYCVTPNKSATLTYADIEGSVSDQCDVAQQACKWVPGGEEYDGQVCDPNGSLYDKTVCDAAEKRCSEINTVCTPSDDYVCSKKYGSSWHALPDSLSSDGDTCVIKDGDGSDGPGWWEDDNDMKICEQCYNANSVAVGAVDKEKSGYCLKRNQTGIYYYGSFVDIIGNGNESKYTHHEYYDGNEIGCLGNNKYKLYTYNYNGTNTNSYSSTTVSFDSAVLTSTITKTILFNVETELGVNLVNNLPSQATVSFEGWRFDSYGQTETSYAQYKNNSGNWVKFTNSTSAVNATAVKRLIAHEGSATLSAVWKETTITLPTITKEGYSCGWTIEDGISRAAGTIFPSGSQFTVSSKSSTKINLTGTCTLNSSGSSGTSTTNVLDDQYVCFSGPAEGWYWDLYGKHKNDPNYHYYETMDWLACRKANGGSLDPDQYMPYITVDAGNGYIAESDDISGWTPNMKKYQKGCLISGTNTSCSVVGEVDAVFSGKTFKGWGESKTCTSGKKVSEYNISNNITLYACWAEGVSDEETDDVAVDIVLDANGGHIAESDEISNWKPNMTTYTKTCFINSNKQECSVLGEVDAELNGKIFKGWGESKTCTSGKKVSEYSVSKNTTLYACWVSSSTGGGSGATQIAKPTNSLCKSGLKYTGSSQNITSATSGTGYTLSGYKQKDAGTYTVTATLLSGYEWNDGSNGTTSFKCSISKVTPNVTLSKTSLSVNEGEETTFTEKANVTGSFSNVSGKTNVATVNPGSYSNVSANTTRTVSVVGIAAGTSVVKITFTPTDTKNYNSTDVSLTVKVNGSSSTVAPSSYTITYNKNGGEGSMNTSSCTYGSNCTLSANTYTRDGYTFVGWTTTPSSSLVVYSDKQSFTYDRDANLTLYAVWSSSAGGGDTSITYTATFNPNGGTLSGQGTLTCDTTSDSCDVTGLPTASRSGYTFKGWGETSSCTTGNSSKLTLTKDTSYYACWQSNSTGGGDIENPQTGEGMIVFVAILGIAAISYLVYYYKKLQNN